MDDARLARELVQVTATEREARDYLARATYLPERDAALVVLRHLVAVRKSLECWIAARACRAQSPASL